MIEFLIEEGKEERAGQYNGIVNEQRDEWDKDDEWLWF